MARERRDRSGGGRRRVRGRSRDRDPSFYSRFCWSREVEDLGSCLVRSWLVWL